MKLMQVKVKISSLDKTTSNATSDKKKEKHTIPGS